MIATRTCQSGDIPPPPLMRCLTVLCSLRSPATDDVNCVNNPPCTNYREQAVTNRAYSGWAWASGAPTDYLNSPGVVDLYWYVPLANRCLFTASDAPLATPPPLTPTFARPSGVAPRRLVSRATIKAMTHLYCRMAPTNSETIPRRTLRRAAASCWRQHLR